MMCSITYQGSALTAYARVLILHMITRTTSFIILPDVVLAASRAGTAHVWLTNA